jgi:hypothetical protein
VTVVCGSSKTVVEEELDVVVELAIEKEVAVEEELAIVAVEAIVNFLSLFATLTASWQALHWRRKPPKRDSSFLKKEVSLVA